MDDPVDVPSRVQADVRGHGREEHMLGGSDLQHGNSLSLEVTDRTNAVCPKELEAADMEASEDHDRIPGLHANDARRREVVVDVSLARRERFGDSERARLLDVLDVGESLSLQQLAGDVLRGLTHAGDLDQPECRRLRRRLGSDRFGSESVEPRHARQGHPTHELAPAQALSVAHEDLLPKHETRSHREWTLILPQSPHPAA